MAILNIRGYFKLLNSLQFYSNDSSLYYVLISSYWFTIWFSLERSNLNYCVSRVHESVSAMT